MQINSEVLFPLTSHSNQEMWQNEQSELRHAHCNQTSISDDSQLPYTNKARKEDDIRAVLRCHSETDFRQ